MQLFKKKKKSFQKNFLRTMFVQTVSATQSRFTLPSTTFYSKFNSNSFIDIRYKERLSPGIFSRLRKSGSRIGHKSDNTFAKGRNFGESRIFPWILFVCKSVDLSARTFTFKFDFRFRSERERERDGERVRVFTPPFFALRASMQSAGANVIFPGSKFAPILEKRTSHSVYLSKASAIIRCRCFSYSVRNRGSSRDSVRFRTFK